MEIIDVHNHLLSEEFDNDREEVIENAKAAGVIYSITVAESYAESLELLDYAKNNNFIKPCIGIYPANFGDFKNSDKIMNLIKDRSKDLTGIGEVGLDFWRAKTEKEKKEQVKLFIDHIELAKELGLPLNIHSRSAGHYVIQILKERKVKKACLHAFDGKTKYALEGCEAGFYFSIPTSVMFSTQKIKLVKALPVKCMLAETDSPVLGPVKNERNELKNITLVLEKIAELKNEAVESVSEILRENTFKLFRI